MFFDDEQPTRAEILPLRIVWRNPMPVVRGHLSARERSTLYYDGRNKLRRFGPVPSIGKSDE